VRWPHGAATAAVEQLRHTALGYRIFRCPACRRICNARTGSPFKHLQYPTDLELRLRDLAEMFPDRGFVFSHAAVRDWEARFAPLLADRLRAKRRGTAGTKWHADETYVSCCTGCEEQRQYFRMVARSGEAVSPADRRRVFPDRWTASMAEMVAA